MYCGDVVVVGERRLFSAFFFRTALAMTTVRISATMPPTIKYERKLWHHVFQLSFLAPRRNACAPSIRFSDLSSRSPSLSPRSSTFPILSRMIPTTSSTCSCALLNWSPPPPAPSPSSWSE